MRLNMGEFRVIWILNIPYIIFTNSIVKKKPHKSIHIFQKTLKD